MNLSVPDYILSIKPYSPGKPMEELEREYGIEDSVKIASNENPLGPSPMAVKAITDAVGNLHRYPDGGGYYLVKKIAEKFGILQGNVVLGSGSDDVLGMLTRAFLGPGDEAIMAYPSFLMYDILVRTVGAIPIHVPLKSFSNNLIAMKDRISSKTRMIFITNPNNPTGTIVSGADFKEFLENIPADIIVVIDEAYVEFVKNEECLNFFEFFDNRKPLVALRTFSKAYGLAGLRVGYGILPEKIAEFANRVRQPFNVNSLAQVGALAAIDDLEFLNKTVELVHSELDYMFNALSKRGIRWFPTDANFFLIDVGKDANIVFERMLRHGIIVRSMTSYSYPTYIRVNVGLHEENVRFIQALEKVLNES